MLGGLGAARHPFLFSGTHRGGDTQPEDTASVCRAARLHRAYPRLGADAFPMPIPAGPGMQAVLRQVCGLQSNAIWRVGGGPRRRSLPNGVGGATGPDASGDTEPGPAGTGDRWAL